MTGPLLVADAATLRYGRGPVVVHEASLAVAPGDAVGIVGESGSGKSTLARALVGDLHPAAGAVLVNGRPWRDVGRRDPERRMVQLVFQDPYSALNPRLSPRAAVAEALRVVAEVPRGAADERAGALLSSVGLDGTLQDRSVRRLSGGQRQRVVVARALACDPAILVADEPTSSLDVSVQAQILNLLLDLRRERGLGLVLVTHDLAVLAHMTRTAVVMHEGHVVEAGPTAEITRSPRHPYTKVLMGHSHADPTEVP